MIPLYASNLPSHSSSPGQLRLEAAVEAPTPWYPGQYGRLIYRIYYLGDIALSVEQLPLLDAQGFLKIGEKEIKDYAELGMDVQEISQRVQAIQTGSFAFPASIIEGSLQSAGTNTSKVSLKSQTAPLNLMIAPFPLSGQPYAFKGAVGEFTWKVNMLSPPNLRLGDKITLSIAISGEGIFNTVSLPDIQCQPGFGGFFRLSDLPSAGEMREGSKYFTVEMRPIFPLIAQLPSIEFAFFNPAQAKYYVLRSSPFPLQIQYAYPSLELPPSPPKLVLPADTSWKETLLRPRKNELAPQ